MTKKSQDFRSLLESDIGYLIKIGGVIVAVVMFIILPQKEMEKSLALQAKDIDNISSNHLIHIQDSIKAIEEEIKSDRAESKLVAAKNELRDIEFAKHIVQMDSITKLLKKQLE